MSDVLEDVADWAAIRNAAISELKRLLLFSEFSTENERRVLTRRLQLAEDWTEGQPARGSRVIVVRSVPVHIDPDADTQTGEEKEDHEIKIQIDGNRLFTSCDDRPFTAVIEVERGHPT